MSWPVHIKVKLRRRKTANGEGVGRGALAADAVMGFPFGSAENDRYP
jgi:hypothetical protein